MSAKKQPGVLESVSDDHQRETAPGETRIGSSVTKLLVDWANEQDGWVRAPTREVLTTRQAVSGSVFEQAELLVTEAV
jgi:hypothetical protein